MVTASLLAKPPIANPELRTLLRRLDERLKARFGEGYAGLILFGSRARGDNASDSDADVAVVLRRPVGDRWTVRRRLIEDTYPLLLESGLYIQTWPVSEKEIEDPDSSPTPQLIRNILRDGVAA